MAIHNATTKTFYQGSPQVTKATNMTAPTKGMDSRAVLSMGDPQYCITTNNLLPSEYGMRVRKGYSEHIALLDNGGQFHEVGTIIPFGGEDDNTDDDRLFCATNEGIWDITVSPPVLKLDFLTDGNGDVSQDAGYGVYSQYTQQNEDQLLFYADSKNGLFTYDPLLDTWVRSTEIIGPDEANIIFVTSHQRMLWFIEVNSSVGWYLPQLASSGQATEFFFGNKFRHGGALAGLFSWTVDGGEGVDDYLCAIGRAGDIIPFKGTDPGSAENWGSVGQWFVGAMPRGNKFANEFGGDLQILCSYGLVGLGDLLRGPDGKNVQEFTQTNKIAVLVRRRMEVFRLDYGWDIRYMPSIGSVLISSPEDLHGNYTQFVQNLTTNGWGLWRQVQINAFDEWRGQVYFGDKDGRILVMNTNIDNILLDPPAEGLNGKPINFSILTTYQDMGEPALFKRAKYVREDFLSITKPAVESVIRYDYNIDDFGVAGVGNPTVPAIWDTDLWDAAAWTAEIPQGFNQLTGAWGSGRTIAVATRGSSTTETTLLGWNIMWDAGGPT